ncbi:unnamed protein product [Spirodela intermedia]|uniref:Uncharacterized protein n=1 Tax=Spirodela intermedia TaxID=51605 RepID=A0A7I8I859_SPIIN|nr:unnamed protein product [Spirodela intermedia]CAA6653836.1 unnamed protein product [Spirodela intermedia]
MGGGKRKSSSRSFFAILFRFSGRPSEARRRGRVWASDEDRGSWVGEPDIDRKAAEFIANFHTRRQLRPLDQDQVASL